MTLDLIQFFLFLLPALWVWQQGRLKVSLELPPSKPETADFGPLVILFILLTVELSFAWYSALVTFGWDGLVKIQGGGL